MTRSIAAVAVVAFAATPAAADTKFAIGASLGSTSGEAGRDEVSTRGLFARIGLGSRLWAQVEIGSGELEDLDDSTWKSRRGALALRVDLNEGSRWTPYLLGAIGGERWFGGGWDYGTESDFTSRELGGGLDLALGTDVALGVDVRFGRRDLEQTRWTDDDVVIAIVPPSPPIDTADGSYSSLRLTLTAKL
jgi:hypothetical protein